LWVGIRRAGVVKLLQTRTRRLCHRESKDKAQAQSDYLVRRTAQSVCSHTLQDIVAPKTSDTESRKDVPAEAALINLQPRLVMGSDNFCGAAVEIENGAGSVVFAADVRHADGGVRGG